MTQKNWVPFGVSVWRESAEKSMRMSQSRESQLKDLRPSKWMRLLVFWRKWDRALHVSEACFALGLVGFVSLMVQSRLNPRNILLDPGVSSFWVFVAMSFALLSLIVFVRQQHPTLFPRTKDALVGMLVLLTSIAAFKLLLIFQMDVLGGYFVGIPSAFFLFLTPVAAPAMVLRLLMKPAQVIFFSVLHALCMAFLLEKAYLFGAHVMVSSMAGALFIAQATTRSTLHLAGFKTALVSGVMGLIVALAWGGTFPLLSAVDPSLVLRDYSVLETALWCLAGAMMGGWFSSVVALTLTPLVETILDYTTDLKLLELARMDHPLLRELVLKAPGTYHHSIIVGSLCEAAAEAIGGNALLARVAAYYHDIGKIGRAEYFVENQSNMMNPHDAMKPHLSAKIIISHVKEGRNLAREHKLGEALTAFIMQHHGRSLVSYFFNKAQQEAAQPGSAMSPDAVSEEDFRYPGPNPRTRETAIMALADSCEAATRSLVDPTPARIEAMVHKIVNKALNDGLLDEADITLREVRLASKAFIRILLGLHHHRVEYPDQERGLPKQQSNVTPLKSNKGS
jgi:cyclic-di-AMP phosphodiesterase PgpH